MVTAPPGGTVRVELSKIDQVYTDGLGKKVKFEENKDSPGNFQGKGKDGSNHAYSINDVLVEISASAAVDNKEMRKRMPGYPMAKADAKKVDDEIKKEAEEAEKAAEAGVESPEVESFKKRSTAPEEAPPGRRAR